MWGPQDLRGVPHFACRKSEAPGAFQAREEGRSRRPGPAQSQLQRRQSSPALCREVSTACLLGGTPLPEESALTPILSAMPKSSRWGAFSAHI